MAEKRQSLCDTREIYAIASVVGAQTATSCGLKESIRCSRPNRLDSPSEFDRTCEKYFEYHHCRLIWAQFASDVGRVEPVSIQGLPKDM